MAALSLRQRIIAIRNLSQTGTDTQVQQGRELRAVRDERAWTDGYASFSDFLTRAPIGISEAEAYRRIQVADLVDSEPSLPAKLPWSILRRLATLARQDRPQFDALVADPALATMTVAELDAKLSSRPAGSPWVTRTAGRIKAIRERLAGLADTATDELVVLAEEARLLWEAASRHVTTQVLTSPAYAPPMESMDHGHGLSENHGPSMAMVPSAPAGDTEIIQTDAGDITRPLTRSAVLAALAEWDVGDRAQLVDAHGVEAVANTVACIRWEMAKGGPKAPRKPGAILRVRLSKGVAPSEEFLAMLRRLPEAPVVRMVARPADEQSGPEDPFAQEGDMPPELAPYADRLRSIRLPNGRTPSHVMTFLGMMYRRTVDVVGDRLRLGDVPAWERERVRKWLPVYQAAGVEVMA